MHKKSVEETQYIICECGDNFPNERLLNFHLENDHADVETFQCEYCAEIFPSAQLYRHHIKQHNVRKPENKPLQNPKPSKMDTSPGNVVKKEPKSPLSGHTPTISVVNLEKLKNIDDITLIQGPVSEQLDVAPEIAAEEIAETDTLPSEEDEERYYQCTVCHKIFASEDLFHRHYNKVHANLLPADNDTEYIQEAPLEDSTEEPLESTESRDYSIQEYQGTEPIDEVITEIIKVEETEVSQAVEQVTYYKCDSCNVLYPSERAYDSHYHKKHSGPQIGFELIEQDLEGPYLPPPMPKQDVVLCESCNRMFANKRSYAIHYRRVHCPRPVKPRKIAVPSRDHECNMCGRTFISNYNLVSHQRTHTGEKPYQCSECPKRFSLQQLLQIHFRTHTGERPYECTHCPKAFKNRAALNRHNRVHTGAKPYSCQHCGKSFSQSNSMKLHVKTVHLKLPAPYKDRRNKNQ